MVQNRTKKKKKISIWNVARGPGEKINVEGQREDRLYKDLTILFIN